MNDQKNMVSMAKNGSFLRKQVIRGVIFVLILLFIPMIGRQFIGFDEIQWHGETFKLKKKYLNYGEYKNDCDPFVKGEDEHIKKTLISVIAPESTRSLKELQESLRRVRFPGFGWRSNGGVKGEHGKRYVLYEYAIPLKNECRSLLYRVNPDGTCEKVLDGVSVDHENDHALGDFRVSVEGNTLRHYLNGVMYREIPLDRQ